MNKTNLFKYISSVIIIISVLIGQESASTQGSFGTVTIDGKIWNQVALRPVMPFGKFRVALDLILYIDEGGNFRKDDWDFSNFNSAKNTIIDKIYYISYGKQWDPFYFRVGALDYVTLGYGILVNGYSNTIQYPQVRKIGLDLRFKKGRYATQSFINDFKENIGVTGLRISTPISGNIRAGITIVLDRNQFLALKDSDKDNRPNIVDDFPNDDARWLDSDGDGIEDDADPDADGDNVLDGGMDINDDGIIDGTETVDLDNDGIADGIPFDDDIALKNDLVRLDKGDAISAIAFDVSYPLVSEANRKISLYAQAAKLIGSTINPVDQKKVDSGIGLVPFGLATTFGPIRFNLEYRVIPEKGRFDFSYWNRSYDIERVTFQNNTEGDVEVFTKESQLGRFGSQKGYYSRLNLDIGSLVTYGIEYQNLTGDVWNDNDSDFENIHNQSFNSTLTLRKGISKIRYAQLYYQQRNVPNPFEFEFTESSVMGYRVGIEISSGLILNYFFSRSFRDLNGDGQINSEEFIDITSVETTFSF